MVETTPYAQEWRVDTSDMPKEITMRELIAERTKHIPRYDMQGGYKANVSDTNNKKSDMNGGYCDCKDKCGCGGC